MRSERLEDKEWEGMTGILVGKPRQNVQCPFENLYLNRLWVSTYYFLCIPKLAKAFGEHFLVSVACQQKIKRSYYLIICWCKTQNRGLHCGSEVSGASGDKRVLTLEDSHYSFTRYFWILLLCFFFNFISSYCVLLERRCAMKSHM